MVSRLAEMLTRFSAVFDAVYGLPRTVGLRAVTVDSASICSVILFVDAFEVSKRHIRVDLAQISLLTSVKMRIHVAVHFAIVMSTYLRAIRPNLLVSRVCGRSAPESGVFPLISSVFWAAYVAG